MPTYTQEIGLTKPSVSDLVDISVINSNMDKIDKYASTLTQMCTAYGAHDATSFITTDAKTVNLGTIIKNGDRFSPSNGGVKVNANGFVFVTAQIVTNELPDLAPIWVALVKNEKTDIGYIRLKAGLNWETFTVASKLTAVSKDDVITVKIKQDNEDGGVAKGNVELGASFMNVMFYQDVN